MPPLTPLDIQHKEFTKAMRGYAMHEVDTFLDQVTEEFTRLQDEVTRLREQAAAAQQGGVPAQAAAPPPPAPAAPPQVSLPPGDPRAGEEAIARALVMAQRMADQTVEEAKAKAKAMVGEAEARAKSVTEQSQLRAREVTEAAAPSGPVAPNPPPGMSGNNSRPLPGSEDLPALPTGARQVNNSYPLREAAGDQLGHNGRDRVDRMRHDD